ncbi:hypothetical protein, partial [Luedemannella flava]|uniref:hypothetical protein n=1 Tax=Luedemannella flava TaxID=349316 RepID=UPI0031E493FA
SHEMFEADLDRVRQGSLSPVLRDALDAANLADGETLVRRLGERILRDKGYFALHADPHSRLMYDAMFWLHSHLRTPTSYEDFVHLPAGQVDYGRPCYLIMIATSLANHPYGFCTGGYAEGFLRDWWNDRTASGTNDRTASGTIVAVDDAYRLTAEYAAQLVSALRAIDGETS